MGDLLITRQKHHIVTARLVYADDQLMEGQLLGRQRVWVIERSRWSPTPDSLAVSRMKLELHRIAAVATRSVSEDGQPDASGELRDRAVAD